MVCFKPMHVTFGSFHVNTISFFRRSTSHHLQISSKLALLHHSMISKIPENFNSISLQLRKLYLFEILLVAANRVYLLADNLDEILREIIE